MFALRVITFFFYLYSVQFAHAPLGMGTRALMGFAGIAMFAARFAGGPAMRVFRGELLIAVLMGGISVAGAVAVILNGTTDLAFVKYPVSLVMITFAAYFASRVLVSSAQKDPIRDLIDTFIVVIVIQSVLAAAIFASPSVKALLQSVQVFSELDQGLFDEVEGVRIVGFGSKFFDAGVVHGFGLLLIAYRCFYNENTARERHALSLAFILVFFVGVMMARTTLVGFMLAIVLLVASPKPLGFSANRKTFYLYLLSVPFVLYAVYLAYVVGSDLEALVDFAFEIFLNMSENGTVESKSTNQLLDMYDSVDGLPLMLGDGYFADPLYSDVYYKSVDVGYLRLILYFGLPGMLVFFLFQFSCIWHSLTEGGFHRMFILALGVYLLLLNMKGFVDFYYLIIPFAVVWRLSKKLADDTSPVSFSGELSNE